jgi:hypothetical protein
LATPVKVAAPGLSGVGVSPELLAFVNDHLGQQLTFEGLEVFPPANISAVLGLERQKQLLGCGDASCMAELANALGVDALLIGSLARLDDIYQLDTRLVGATDGKAVALFSKRVSTDAALLDAMREAAAVMAPQLAARLSRTLTPIPRAEAPPPVPVRNTPPPTAAMQPPPTWPTDSVRYERRPTTTRVVGQWILIGGGAIATVGLVGLFAATPTNVPPNAPSTPEQDAFASVFLGGLVVGAAGLVVFLVGGTERVPVKAALLPLPGGGALSLSGRF